jgi:soluble lytic murein transglycosylase-like protein
MESQASARRELFPSRDTELPRPPILHRRVPAHSSRKDLPSGQTKGLRHLALALLLCLPGQAMHMDALADHGALEAWPSAALLAAQGSYWRWQGFATPRTADPGPRRAATAFPGSDEPDPPRPMLKLTPERIPDLVPEPSRKQIEQWVQNLAPEYELEPELVLAVIAVESTFNPRARSHKNAHGLMQLIPATARRFGVSDIHDPLENLKGGMAYLQWLKGKFKGNLDLVLAGYNAGEGAVRRFGGIPPYKETQRYVKRVRRGYLKARERLASAE